MRDVKISYDVSLQQDNLRNRHYDRNLHDDYYLSTEQKSSSGPEKNIGSVGKKLFLFDKIFSA